jgi:hypothetical protein
MGGETEIKPVKDPHTRIKSARKETPKPFFMIPCGTS